MFYCMFYFTCDRSFTPLVDRVHVRTEAVCRFGRTSSGQTQHVLWQNNSSTIHLVVRVASRRVPLWVRPRTTLRTILLNSSHATP